MLVLPVMVTELDVQPRPKESQKASRPGKRPRRRQTLGDRARNINFI